MEKGSVIINGKTIEISEESYREFKNSFDS